MAEDIVDISNKLWTGDLDGVRANPMGQMGAIAEVAPGVAFVPSFGNVSAFSTTDGLVLFDTGNQMSAEGILTQIRTWSDLRVHTVVYTHGHIDHVMGIHHIEAEAAERKLPGPTVVAHAGVHRRFDRYVLTDRYNAIINQRQFGLPNLRWPTDYRYPDVAYHRSHDLEVGGVEFHLHHAKGETDDHTWTWVPSKKVICSGDLFIWTCPNAGNPQKVQRYPKDWSEALREMAQLPAEILLPGHGLPVFGRERIAQAFGDSADLLDSLHDQTVELMNDGLPLNEIVHSVKIPEHLLEKPYLQPIYDEPEFLVRNIWRFYGGWYDGNPAELKPARFADLAAELADLAGGAKGLAARASELADEGNFRVACHLAELASHAGPADAEIHRIRASVYEKRSSSETSLMAKGIYRWAASESQKHFEPG